MSRERVFEIARWEYTQKVRSKAFLVSLILFPVFIFGMSFLPQLLISDEPTEQQVVGFLEEGTTIAAAFETTMNARGAIDDSTSAWVVRTYQPDSSGRAAARADALEEETVGYLEAVSADSTEPAFVWRSPNLSDVQTAGAVRSSINAVVRQERLSAAGIDAETMAGLSQPIDFTELKVTEEGESESDAKLGFMVTFFAGFLGVMLFMILVITTGQTLVRGLVEEKSNRIMEILVGTSRPSELMWGKLLGLGGLGLTQVLAWALLGGGAALAAGSTPISGSDAVLNVVSSIPLVLLYLGLGYFFFAALFIGVGALVTTEQEAQMVTQYLSFLLVAPVTFGIAVVQNPNAGWIEAISYIPFLTPTVMMMRVVGGDVSIVTILATSGVLLLSTALVTIAAARIFRTAILLYGKRPTMREILRWFRA